MATSAHVYHSIIQTYGTKIQEEQERYQSIQKAKAPYSPWIWGSLGWIIGIAIGHTWIYGAGGVVIMLLIIGLFRPKYKENTLLAGEISDKAIVKLAKPYFQKVQFDRYGGMSENEFNRLFNQECDSYWSEYELRGVHHDLPFRICNAEGSYEEEYEEDYTDSDGNTYTETHTRDVEIFNGSILRITLPFDLKYPISLGRFKTKEKMDHQAFNDFYSVDCYDRIYARYVLTQSFMDRLVTLAYAIGTVPAIEFDRRFIYIMMDRKLSFDDIGYFTLEHDIEHYANEIERIFKILETIAFYDHHIINNQDRGDA